MNVELQVFNLLGQKVQDLAHGVQSAGRHEISFDASHLPSGVYLYKLNAGSFLATRKMILTK
jgi:hypothetical protein